MHRPVRRSGLVTVSIHPRALPMPVTTAQLTEMVVHVHEAALVAMGHDVEVATRALAGWAPEIGYGQVTYSRGSGVTGWAGPDLSKSASNPKTQPSTAEAISERWMRAVRARPLLARTQHPLCWFRIRVDTEDMARLLVMRLREQAPPWMERVDLQRPPAPAPTSVLWSLGVASLSGVNYRKAAPDGVGLDAVRAKKIKGATGNGVSLADVEQGWWLKGASLAHPDFSAKNITSVLHASAPDKIAHGTRVLGVLYAQLQKPERGCLGMVPGLDLAVLAGTVTVSDKGAEEDDTAQAILKAMDLLEAGDVLLVERQTTAPAGSSDIHVPAEWDDDVHSAICSATGNGIIVVEPAGNNEGGGTDLGSVLTSGGIPLFGDPRRVDSQALLVAAGRRDGTAWKVHSTSNFGSRVNCFADGSTVRTADVGPDLAGTGLAAKLTDEFGESSGASAIIAGAAGIVQGIYKASHPGKHLPPAEMRALLADATLGTSGATGIGVMPDLVKLADKALAMP